MRIIGMRQDAACCACAEVTDARSCRAPCRPEERTLPPGRRGVGSRCSERGGGSRYDAKLIHFNFCRQLFPENVWILGSPLHKRPCPSQPAARCWHS